MHKSTVGELIIDNESCQYGLGLPAEEYESNKIRYLRISDIDDSGNLLEDDKKSVSAPNIKDYILKPDELVVARTGNSTGRTYVCSEGDEKLAYAGFLIKYVFDNEKINPRYMKYFTISDIYKKQISGFSGSTRGNMNAQNFKDITVVYPDREIQDKMVELFDSISKKIKNNNKIISNLESMTKLLYNYWFLQFEFPNEDGKPYKSSGGKMVWNDELKREIPEGWGEISLDKIADMKTVSITPIQTEMYNHYSIPAYDTFKTPTVENGKDINSNKYLVYENCILVSKLNPHFKRIWNIYSINEKSICSTEFMPFLSINGHKEFLYSILNSDAFYRFTINNSNSSTGSRKRMQPEAYKDFKLAYPLNDNKVISKFCDVTRGMLKQQDSLIKENQELISLRDFLLPMLMNGQVTFKEEA